MSCAIVQERATDGKKYSECEKSLCRHALYKMTGLQEIREVEKGVWLQYFSFDEVLLAGRFANTTWHGMVC